MAKELTGATGAPVPSERAGGDAAPLGPRRVPQLAPEPEGGNWARYLAAALRYKWILLGTTLLGLAAGVVGMRMVKPLYVAQATIWVESQPRPGNADQGPIRQAQLLNAAAWIDLLRSYVVLDEAVRAEKLYLTPDDAADSALFAAFGLRERFRPGSYQLVVDSAGRQLTLRSAEGAVIERGAPGDSIGAAVGFAWVPPAEAIQPRRRVNFTVATPRDAARDLAQQLRVETDREGTFLRVELAGTNPVRIAATVNAVLERYVDVAAELKREKLAELAQILEEQLRQAEQNLRTSENALESFRVQTITLPSDRATPVAPGLELTRDPVFANFFDMRIRLEALRRDREAIQRVMAPADDSVMSTGALQAIGAVQNSAELRAALDELNNKRAERRALLYRYTEDHLPVQNLTREIATLETQAVPDLVRGLVAQLRVQEEELEDRVRSGSRELQQIPPRAIQEARLSRDVQIANNLYTMLQQRYEEARLAEVSSIADVRVLDAAVPPQEPVRNRGPQFLLLGLLGGFGLGLVGVLLYDRFDRRVRYPEQVTLEMGLPILGAVPHLKGSGNGRSPVIEALRGVRLSLVHAYGAAGPLVVTVSSPGPGEGKSFIATNLALAFADFGNRTLLIDGDVRRGGLHRLVAASRQPGLTDVLSGRVGWERCARKTEFDGLHFMGCGTRMPRAPELLGSAAMTQLLTSLRAKYSVIIVDSPPLGAGVDAYALSTATANLLLVLRTGSTNRELAHAKLEVLDRLPVRILGAVLNDVRERGVYAYYSYYMPGYDYEVEAEEVKKLRGSAKP